MKSLVFMMMLTMAAVSAGVVYLSINRDPLDGMPHVDVPLEAPPIAEEALATPEATTASTPDSSAVSDPQLGSPGITASGVVESEATVTLPAPSDDSEPLTTTAFPIPEAEDPAAGDATAGGGSEPTAVDQ
jgi:hypothetical protein